MAPVIDPAIIEVLSLDGSAKMASHGGSNFASTFKITSTVNGKEKSYFVKTGTGKEAEVMFAGEHLSLATIHSIDPTFCPQSYAHGSLTSTSNSHFLATDFLSLSSSSSSSSSQSSRTTPSVSLAAKLAHLHSTPAPIPHGFSTPQFGFPVPTCCGSTEQPNDFHSSWAEFYAEKRLRAVLRAAAKRNGKDAEIAALVEETASKVVPRLLGDEHLKDGSTGGKIVPVVVHGDLWSGNHGRGRIGEGREEEIVFDPSSCYAHSEYDLGIMKMFGGFGKGFHEEYHGLKPKDEPVGEFADRVELYELYHHLNHYSLFGDGYRNGGVAIMKRLNKKYGGEQSP